MAKRSRRNAARRREQALQHVKLQPLLANDDLKQVLVWKDRIEEHIRGAQACYRWMEANSLHRHEHALKAMERYVGNTTESIKQLDNLTGGHLFASLVEIPEDSVDKGAMTWRNMIGMRDRLTHKFWETDHDILVSAVRNHFPKLGELFGRLLIVSIAVEDGLIFEIPTSVMKLPRTIFQDGDPMSPGSAFVVAIYGRKSGWIIARMVKRAEPDVVQFVDMHGTGINSDTKGNLRIIWRK